MVNRLSIFLPPFSALFLQSVFFFFLQLIPPSSTSACDPISLPHPPCFVCLLGASTQFSFFAAYKDVDLRISFASRNGKKKSSIFGLEGHIFGARAAVHGESLQKPAGVASLHERPLKPTGVG